MHDTKRAMCNFHMSWYIEPCLGLEKEYKYYHTYLQSSSIFNHSIDLLPCSGFIQLSVYLQEIVS